MALLTDLKAPGKIIISKGQSPVELPFELFGMKLLLHATMNGKKVKLLIDNGRLWDQVWFFNGEDESIQLFYSASAENIEAVGVGETGGTFLREGAPVNIDFGPIQFLDQPTLISPPEAGWANYFPGVDGQVSSLLFKHFVVTFDFEKMVILLTQPESFQPAEGATILTMCQGENDAYFIPAALQMNGDTPVNMELDIDLGGIYALYLYEDEVRNIRCPRPAEKEFLGYGASGVIHGFNGQVDTITLGNQTIDKVDAVFVEKGANLATEIVRQGTIGLPLLQMFKVTFDYFHGNLILENRRNHEKG